MVIRNTTALLLAIWCGVTCTASAMAPPTAQQGAGRASLEQRLEEDWRWRELAAPVPILSDGSLVPLPDGGMFVAANEWTGTYDGYFWKSWSTATLDSDAAVNTAQVVPEGALIYGSNVTLFPASGKPAVLASNLPWRSPAVCPNGAHFAVRPTSLELWREGQLKQIGPGPGVRIQAAACGPRNELWIAVDGALMVWRDSQWRLVPQPTAIPRDTEFFRAVATPDRVLFLPLPSKSPYVAISIDQNGPRSIPLNDVDAPLHDAALFSGGEILGVTWTGGLALQGPAGGWSLVEPSVLKRDSVLALTLIDDERLVVQTMGGRLLSCDLGSNRWQHHSLRHETRGDVVNGICPARAGGVWVASRSGLIRWRDGVEQARFDRALGVSLELVTALIEDDEGSLWVGSGSTFAGVLRLKDGAWERFASPSDAGTIFVHAARRAPDGAIWFLGFHGAGESSRGGVRIFDHGHWSALGGSDGFPNVRCYDVAFGADNEPIVASNLGLLRRHMGQFSILDGSSDRWFSAFRQSNGTLWFGRGLRNRGILTIPPQVASGPERDAIGSGFAGAFAETSDRRLWFGSLFGLSFFDGTLLHRPSLEPGLESLQIWPMVAAAPEEGGGLWLGSVRSGLYLYTPDDRTAPRTQQMDLARVDEYGTARIMWEARDAWNVTPPRLLRFIVELDGEVRPGAQDSQSLELTDLAAGRHSVSVRSVDLAGNYETEARQFVFTIPLPFWQRPAFLATAGVALTSLIVLGATLQQRAKERRRVRNDHHRALSASERHFRSLVEQVEVVLVRSDQHEKLLYVSPRIESITGRPAVDFVKRQRLLHQLVHPDDRHQLALLAEARAQRSTRPAHADLRVLHAGGQWRRVLVRQSPWFGEDGHSRGCDAVLLDVTERRELEEVVTRASKLESLGVMAGGIAHDFNNLLVVILGNADLARGALHRGEVPLAELEAIGLAGERAAEVCRQMLTFAGRSPGVRRVVDAVAVIREVSELMRAAVPHSIDLQLDLPQVPLTVLGDATQLHQVVMNLVLNAAEACEGRTGTIRIATRLTTLDRETLTSATLGSNCEPGAFVEIVVADDGRGMDEATQNRIFDPFFSTKFTGRGLGLAAVLGIVRWHQGCLSVNSRAGFGTAMHVFVPFAGTRVDGIGRSDEAARSGAGTVLIVDDEPLVLETLSSLLRDAGFEPIAASSAARALEWLSLAPAPPAAALLDVTMPDIDGRELASMLRRRLPNLPILLLSGYASEQVAMETPADGRTWFLQKPFRRQELLDTLLRMLADGVRRG